MSKMNSLFMNDIEYEFYLANESKDDDDNESCMHFDSLTPSPTSFFVSSVFSNNDSSSKFVTKKQHLITGAKYNFTAVKPFAINKISKVAYVKSTTKQGAAYYEHYKTDKVNNDQVIKSFGRQTRSVPSKLSRQKRSLEYFLPIDSVVGLGKRFSKNSSLSSHVVMNDDSIYYTGSLGLELSNFGTLRYTLPGFKGFQECDESIMSIYGLPYQRVFDALFSA